MDKSNKLNPVIVAIKFAEISQISGIVQGVDKFHKIISLNSGQNYIQVYFSPGTASFESANKLDDSGEIHNNTLQCKYPGDGSNVPSQIDLINMKRGIVVYTYNDGSVRTFGTLDNPVICTASFSTKDKGYSIVFNHNDTNGSFLI